MKIKQFTLKILLLSVVSSFFATINLQGQCLNDPGTINKVVSFAGLSTRHDIKDTVFLCWKDKMYLDHNDDYSVVSDPVPATPGGVGYIWYTRKPAVSGDDLAAIEADNAFRLDPADDILVSVGELNGDIKFENGIFKDFLSINQYINGGAPSLFYYAPGTVDRRLGDRGYYENGGPCVKVSTAEAFPVVYLNPITINNIHYNVDGDSMKVSFRVSGGLPEFYALHEGKNTDYISISVYDADNPGPSFRGKVLTSHFGYNDSVVVKLPDYGRYNVVITDGVSCANTNQLRLSKWLNPVLSLDTISGQQGEIKCIDFYVRDYKKIGYITLFLGFDPTVLEYVSLNDNGGIQQPYNVDTRYLDNGQLVISWDPLLSSTDTYINKTKHFSLCFKLEGRPGECSPVFFINALVAASESDTSEAIDVFPYFENGLICVDPPPGLSFSYTYCGAPWGVKDASLTFEIFNGTPPYTFELLDDNNTTVLLSGTVNNEREKVTLYDLEGGKNYYLRITDSAGDIYYKKVFVGVIEPIKIKNLQVEPVTCFGRENGKIKLELENANLFSYHIKWSTGIFDVDSIQYLPNGTYGVTIVDADTGCEIDTSVVLYTPPLKLETRIEDSLFCKGATNGKVVARVSGGTPDPSYGYKFKWKTNVGRYEDEDNVESVLENLGEGIVVVKVHDKYTSCYETDTLVLEPLYKLNITSYPEDPKCYGEENGGIGYKVDFDAPGPKNYDLIFPIFPHPPYSNIKKINPDSFYIQQLGSGRYIVRITETNSNCFEEDTTYLSQPSPLLVTKHEACAGCGTGALAHYGITVQGGVSPYTLKGIGNDVVLNGAGPKTYYYNLSPGDYKVVVEDANGCSDSLEFTVSRCPGLLNIDSIRYEPLQCEPGSTTDIYVYASSQFGDITYKWLDMSGQLLGTGYVLRNVTAGRYIIFLQDDKCELRDTIELKLPQLFTYKSNVVKAECAAGEKGGLKGEICVNIDGGNAGYSFVWSNGANTSCIDDLDPGIYIVTISDSSGCEVTDTFDVSGAPPIEIAVTDIRGVSCNDGHTHDGQALIQADGGNNPNGIYTFHLPGGTKIGKKVFVKDLPGGVIHFSVGYNTVSGHSCVKDDSFYVDLPEKISLDLTSMTIVPPRCYGECNGRIVLKAKGGNDEKYYFRWLELNTTGSVGYDLCAGTYHIEIMDANLCKVLDSVVLNQPDELIAEIDSAHTHDIDCTGKNNGQIAVKFSGGNTDGPYTFKWSSGITSNSSVAMNLSKGIYSVTVMDHKGCFDVATYEIKEAPPIVFDVSQRDSVKCYGDKTCIVIDTVYGGAGPEYTYSVNGGVLLPVDSCFELYASDLPYLISVFDRAGCKAEKEFVISQPEKIEVDLGDELQLNLGEPKVVHLNTNTNVKEVIWDIDTVNFKVKYLNDLHTDIELEGYRNDTIYATVIDVNGCTATGKLYVLVNTARNVYIPNIFTPDGDGINDEFFITLGKGVEKVNYFKIYNRWGNLMKYEKDILPANFYNLTWDGTYRGKKLNPGVYVYLVEVKFLDGRVILYRGSVTLIR